MPQSQSQTIPHFLDGLNTNLSPFLMSDNTLSVLENCLISFKLGTITKDTGYVKVKTTIEAGKSILGLHNFRQVAATQKMLATVDDSTSDDTQLWYYDGSANWTEITAAETAWANKATINVEMEDFLTYCFFVGWGSTDGFISPRTLTGTTLGTTNTTSMPNAKYIKRYRDRLYIANTDISGTATPYRVYYSSAPSGTTITWDTTNNFIDVDYSEALMGIGENWDRIFFFTEYSTYMYDQNQIKKVWDIGTTNHRTIRNAGIYMIWANNDGVWISKRLSEPQNIADPIKDFIRAATMSNAFAEVVDEEYWLYLGTVTVNGITYTNTALVFNIPTQSWRIRTFYDTITIFGLYRSFSSHAGKGNRLFMGDTDGMVQDKSKYSDTTVYHSDAAVSTTTDGVPIHSRFITKPFQFGSPSLNIDIVKLTAYAERAQGLTLYARVIRDYPNIRTKIAPTELMELKQFITQKDIKIKAGSFIEIIGVENGKFPYWQFWGMTTELQLHSTKKTTK